MSEIDLLVQINDKLLLIHDTLRIVFITLLIFYFMNWVRHIVNIWKRGNGFHDV